MTKSIDYSGDEYRVCDGKLTFWYEPVRHGKTLEAATVTLIQEIRDPSDLPFFPGEPFLG